MFGPIFLIPLFLIGIVGIFYILGQKKIKGQGYKIEGELEEIYFKEKQDNDRIEEIYKLQENLLFENNVKTKQELDRKSVV